MSSLPPNGRRVTAPRWRLRRPETGHHSTSTSLVISPEERESLSSAIKNTRWSDYSKKPRVEQRSFLRLIEKKSQEAARNLKWQRANRDKVAAQSRRRYARKRGAAGSLTANEWKTLCEYYENQCLRCGTEGKMTVDHIVPLSKGGSNSIDNIQPLCGRCNRIKATKSTDYRHQT